MHELMFQAGVAKRNVQAKRAHSLYILYYHYTNLTFVSECVCESGRSTKAIQP